MATVIFKNAYLFIDGASVRASLNELALEYSAEMLDETAFGDDTRIRKGGLKAASVNGAGHAESGDGMLESVMFGDVGTDDVVVAVFPDGITEGSETTGCGFAMRAVGSEFNLGGGVGTILPLRFAYEGRGIEA